jgi:hypothetical protein
VRCTLFRSALYAAISGSSHTTKSATDRNTWYIVGPAHHGLASEARSTGGDPFGLASEAALHGKRACTDHREYRGAAASQTYRFACISLENIPGSYRIQQ